MADYSKCTDECHIANKAHLLHHIKNKIPAKIGFGQIGLLPSRKDFIDPVLGPGFAKQVAEKKPIIFLPTSVCEKNDFMFGVMKYSIYLFGVLPCGSKACVILNNVPVYVDVMVPDNMTSREYDNQLRGQLNSNSVLKYSKMEDVQLFRLHGFQKAPRVYKRIHFNNLQDRKKFIEYIDGLNRDYKKAGKPLLETASDDNGSGDYYFAKVARERRFATADWNRFEKYEVLAPTTTTNCSYVFRVDLADFAKLGDAQRREYLSPKHSLSKVVEKDSTQVCMWDIETHRTIQNGIVPTPKDIDFTIFMICSAYYHHHSDEALLEICCVNTATKARPGIGLVVECGTEKNVLLAHMEIVGNMAPDIMGAFNGGSFDWPLYRAQVTRCGLLTKLKSKFSSLPLTKSDTEISVLKWCFKKASVKIDAETKHDLECVANFPGLLDTDVLPVFLKMYPRAEVRKGGSLNFFLSKNNLESKEDMPYKRMFKIYERSVKLMNIKSCHCGTAQSLCACCKEVVPSIDCHEIEPEIYNDELLPGLEKCCFCGKKPQNAIDMGNVGYYCVVDCVRPQQLYVKRMIIPDKRELSNMSYVALHDSFYRADGMKVCNLIGAYCFKRGVAFSNARVHKTKEEKDHYPGAWVFPPNRGLHSDQMMDIDMLGPDGTIITVRKRGRPITGLDFASLYPSLMMTYNLSPDMVVYDHDVALMLETEGYTIHHIKPFNYEVGEEKGKAENKKKTAQGWTVRHNGIFNPKDEEIVTSYVKHETYNSEGLSKPIKYQSEVGPTVEQQDTISKLAAEGKKINRKVTYEPIRGRKKLPGERMGIFPFIVKKLFDKRVPIKAEFVRLEKLLEEMNLQGVKTLIIDGRTVTYKDISFEKNKVDSKQKALKVLANTFYGKSGDYTSAIYELLVAAGITTAGQENIKRVAKFVTDRGFTVNYGDSVTADTPILIKTTSEQIDYWEIRELASYWKPYGDKEVSDCNAYAWSDQGWTKINRVIRHRTTKNIYRVLTHTGCVDVTSDHSLLDSQAKKIRPTDVNVGTKLLHADLPITDITYPIDDTKIANASLYHFMSSTGDIMEVDSNSAVANIKADPETANNVVSVTNLGPTEEYVYDLETENHHFAAGVGRLIVHNTDSVYVSCPDDVYAKCDNEYETAMADIHTQFAGIENIPEPVPNTAEAEYKLARTRARIVWWTEQVSITMKLMTQINEQVADHLLANNGTVFLKTAYEEVGFPSGFCGKKKYFLTAHIENINFYPKDIFIRGIDIVKQGQAKISKQLGEEFMREVLAPENERTMMDFAEDKIRKYYRTALDIALFTLNARYRPDKQNVAVRIFVDRMKEAQKRATDPILKAIFEPPEAGDKFEYIVVKKEQRYTLQGTKVELKKGDLMEYPRVYTASQNSASPMCIDLDYYMKGQVAGIFARFIAYHPMFQPPKGMFDISDKDGYQDMDKYCVNKAKKYIAKICDSITGCDPAALTAQGADYRKIYNRADKQIRIDVGAKYGNMKFILCDLPDRSVWSNNEGNSNAYSSQIIAHMKALASVYRSNIGARYIEINTQRKLFSVFELRRIYSSDNGIGKTRVRMYDRKETEIVESLYQYMPDLLELLQTYNKNIAEVIEDAKRERDTDIEICESDLDSINNFDTHELAIITKVYKLFVELQCVYQSRADILSTMSAIELERARIMNTHIEPVINIIAEARSESKAAEVLGEYEWS